ncbi:general substrate transporter [Neurospora tetrasperma FGSC 2509]|nr:general substrate transporter [Neurospora tetrasperma FGSC 2509]
MASNLLTATVERLPETSLWTNSKCLLICALVSLASMQYGLDSACLAAFQAMPGFLKVFGYPDPSAPGGFGIGHTFQQLLFSFLTLGSLLSTLFAGPFSHLYGRRPALLLACFLTAFGTAIQIGTSSAAALYVGRIILGIGNGFLVTFSNIYCAEVAPPHLRGVMVALFSEWVCVGSVLGATVTNATKKWLGKASWRVPLGMLFVVPVMLSAGVWWVVPESPRWEVSRGRHQEGRMALERVRAVREDGKEGQQRLEVEWVEMVKGIEEEKRLASTVGPLDMFRGSDLRRTLLCFGVIATQAGSGSWFYISYSTYFMIVSGLPVDLSFRYSILKTYIGFIGVNVGMYLMRFVMGRRTLMTTGAMVQGMFMLDMAISAITTEAGTWRARDSLMACSALVNYAHNAFVGVASYPVATELVSTRLRPYTVGAAISLGYLLAWLTSFCSPYFINPENMTWGAKYGFIWAGPNFCCALFFFGCLPELKGRALEEIDELFEQRAPAWKLKSAETRRGEVGEDGGKAATVEIVVEREKDV